MLYYAAQTCPRDKAKSLSKRNTKELFSSCFFLFCFIVIIFWILLLDNHRMQSERKDYSQSPEHIEAREKNTFVYILNVSVYDAGCCVVLMRIRNMWWWKRIPLRLRLWLKLHPTTADHIFLFSGKVFKNTIKWKKLFWTSSWFPLSPAYSIRPHCSLHLLNFSKWVDVISRGNSDFHRTTWCRICALDCIFYDVYVLVGNNNTTSVKSRNPDFAESFLLLNLDFEYFIYCTYDTNVA